MTDEAALKRNQPAGETVRGGEVRVKRKIYQQLLDWKARDSKKVAILFAGCGVVAADAIGADSRPEGLTRHRL